MNQEEFRVGDIVRLSKLHPCGGATWRITRLGADFGLRCETCGHYVMLERAVLKRRVKELVARGEAVDPAQERLIFERSP
jgi:hypothetical protein